MWLQSCFCASVPYNAAPGELFQYHWWHKIDGLNSVDVKSATHLLDIPKPSWLLAIKFPKLGINERILYLALSIWVTTMFTWQSTISTFEKPWTNVTVEMGRFYVTYLVKSQIKSDQKIQQSEVCLLFFLQTMDLNTQLTKSLSGGNLIHITDFPSLEQSLSPARHGKHTLLAAKSCVR